MRRMATTTSPTGLFWSQRGEIACAAHTPYVGSDTWIWDRWEPMPQEAAHGYAQRGYVARCESCGKEAATDAE